MQRGLITINADNRIVNTKIGEEVPPMFNRGGMKKFFEFHNIPIVGAANNNIILEGSIYGSLGPEGLVHVTTLDLENNVITDEVIDVEVNEKRKKDEIYRRCMRPRLDDEHIIPPPPRSDDHGTTSTDAVSASTPENAPQKAPKKPEKKYRYASELDQIIDASTIGERIMDTVIELPVRQVLAVAPDVVDYIHDMTRKRRIPINASSESTAMQQMTKATPITMIT